MDQVAEVKSKTDIVAVINEHVPLTKAGQNYKANCPFHGEKTPSFVVSPELQIYKCFGCGESGDVFTFLEKYDGMEFYESLQMLAEKAGVILRAANPQSRSDKEKIIKINETAATLYNYLLTKHPSGEIARKYLKDRDISEESIEVFKIGFAPDKPNILFNYLVQKKKFSSHDIEKAGLIVNVRGQMIDRFRGRIIFPICDPRGNTIALAGRILINNKKIAKYINSPETLVYHKSSSLYGLNITRNEIKRAGEVVVTEGEIDTISSWQTGTKNVVAIKGTAFTKEQINILSRFTSTINLALDSDFAGNKAAVRSVSMAQTAGFEVKVASLGKYGDPDEFARADPAGYKKVLSESVGIWDFLINFVTSQYDPYSGTGKTKISREIIPILDSIPDKIVQSHYVAVVAGKLGVPTEAVSDQLRSADVKKQDSSSPEKQIINNINTKTRRELLEESFFALSLQGNIKLILNPNFSKFVNTPILQKIHRQLLEYMSKNKSYSVNKFAEALPKELLSKFEDLVLNSEEEKDAEKEINVIFKAIYEISLKEKMTKLAGLISQYEEIGESNNLIGAKKEFANISNKLVKLKSSELSLDDML